MGPKTRTSLGHFSELLNKTYTHVHAHACTCPRLTRYSEPLPCRSFAKSTTYFLSAPIVRQVVESFGTLFARSNHRAIAAQPQWEAVHTGMALALGATSAMGPLTAVHAGTTFSEGWGSTSDGVRSSTLVWHAGSSHLAHAIVLLDRWAKRHRCNASVALVCQRTYTSCSGAPWRRCDAKQGTDHCDTSAEVVRWVGREGWRRSRS